MQGSRPASPLKIDAWGVASGYEDARGDWHDTSPDTRRAIHAAMRVGDEPSGKSRPEPPLVIHQGSRLRLSPSERVRLEDGSLLDVRRLPGDIPLGYHTLEKTETGQEQRLIVAPGECFLPDDMTTWGWSAQLYSVRSAQSWGMGDLADLARLARWSAKLGAGVLLINPLTADAPVLPQQASPYSPTSRCYRNLLYISIDEVPGASDSLPVVDEARRAARKLNADSLIDRNAIFKLKLTALQALWDRFSGDPEFDCYLAEQGKPLENFSRYCALAERFGRNWRTWPNEYRSSTGQAVNEFAISNLKKVRFHTWVQWLLDVQLGRASRELPLMQDLPIGMDPGGADAWGWQDSLAAGAYVGAPPDLFNSSGQNWGLAPFIPHHLRKSDYEPFIQTIRSAVRHAGGLRIDHVMGMFRLYWIPEGAAPSEGAYVYYPAEDLLPILALESHRARAIIVGEDLGTVDPSIRKQLAARRVLSYRIVWFEKEPPEKYPRQALTAVSTHDLPTLAGLWTGQDARDQESLGLGRDVESWRAVRSNLQELTESTDDTDAEKVIRATYRRLAKAPCVIVAAAIEDALAIEHRPNMPGTCDEWPNWCQALPVEMEELEHAPLAHAIAEKLNARV